MEKLSSPATAAGPAETFTGDVYVEAVPAAEGATASVALVRFTPGARTFWHSHPAGQTLRVTEGLGLVGGRDAQVLVLRPGDTVWTPPGEEHWHGASADRMLCHVAITGVAEGKDPADWLEEVDEATYEKAQSALHAD